MASRPEPAKPRPAARLRRRPARRRRRARSRLAPSEVRLLYERLRKAIPAPRSELVYRSPFQLLVSVILSAQATDRSVNLATRPLFAAAPTPEAIAALGVRGLARYIRTIGLWRMKAKNVVAASRLLLEHHGGKVPRDRESLEALPGVGRKTANVVLNVAFGEPTIAVDTHIFRVSNRTGLAPGGDVREVEDGLVAVTPAEFALHAHHWLILHGRYTCTARKPKCPECPIRDICRWPHKTPAAVPITFSGRRGR
jgi:endonuclease-3